MAEITMHCKFGRAVFRAVRSYSLRKILEIGSFDGDGSTQVLAVAMAPLPGRDLTCLEMREDRFSNLLRNTSHLPWVKAVRASSIAWESFTAKDFDKDVWPGFGDLPKDVYDRVKSWWVDDVRHIKQETQGFLEQTKNGFDAALIDGGEFSGFDEFRLLKDRVDCFFLDDVFHAFKNRRVYEVLLASTDWRAVFIDRADRNGTAIFVRKTRLGNRIQHLFREARGWTALFLLLATAKIRRIAARFGVQNMGSSPSSNKKPD